MDEIYSRIRQVGPMFIIEGGIFFKQPFRSIPLDGFEDNSFKDSEDFLNSINEHSIKWFKNFPDCCNEHKKLKSLENFKKSDYDYIPQQISNNIKYFAHSIERFINVENGMDEIKDYYDYLMESLGRPFLGGHIFSRFAEHFIENGTVENGKLTDDQKIELLQHLEPTKPPLDIKDRELEVLYTTFQKWIETMPNIGKFKEFKELFIGKVPLNIFAQKPKHNKYLGTSSFNTKSKKELLNFLIKMTNDILKLSKEEIKKENYNKEQLLLTAEERLNLQQKKILEELSEQEISYINLIESWLNITIEYYTVLNSVITETNTQTLIESLSELKDEILSLYKNDKVSNWVKKYLTESSYYQLVESIDKLNNQESEEIFKSLKSNIDLNEKNKISDLEYKLNSPEISIKHKIKISIPLFLFTKYEQEIELSDKQKLPKNIKDLKNYLGFG